MNRLIDQMKIQNKNLLKKTIHKIVATELSKLAEPCHYPDVQKYYFQLLNLTGLKREEVRKFVKEFYKGTKAEKWLLQQNDITNFYIALITMYMEEKDQSATLSTTILYLIMTYSSLMHKFLSFCLPHVFKYTLDNISKTHLFSQKKNIANALYYLSQEVLKKHKKKLESGTPEDISDFIQACRTRVAQSVKSFVRIYRDTAQKGLGYEVPKTFTDEEGDKHLYSSEDKVAQLVDKITKKITLYGRPDVKSSEEARKITGVSKDFANVLSGEISHVRYTKEIQVILELYIKQIQTKDQLCGNYEKLVKSLMGIKRTTALIYFKQQVQILTNQMMKNLKLESKFKKLPPHTKFSIYSFVGYYLTSVLRNSVC